MKQISLMAELASVLAEADFFWCWTKQIAVQVMNG